MDAPPSPIELLDHRDPQVAATIHALLQRSYRVEAELMGITEFPPLQRTLNQVRQVGTEFRGCWFERELTAAVELKPSGSQLEICSLVVDPNYFRRGLASLLLRHILSRPGFSTVVVETAAANLPALALYRSHGFRLNRHWTTAEGIAKVALTVETTA